MNLLKEQLARIKRYFSIEEVQKSEVNKSISEIIVHYNEEKSIVKALFNNDIIGLDEYVEKMRMLDERVSDVVKKDKTVYSYADAIIRNGVGDILFLRRNSNDALFPDQWGLPGGKIEDGESAEEAVKRETIEETNKTILETYLIARKKLPNGGVINYFNCCVKDIDGYIILNNDEHYSYQFINRQDYHKYVFIKDLADVLTKIDERYNHVDRVLVVKSDSQTGVTHVDGIEFVTEDRDKKYTVLTRLKNDNQISSEFFLEFLQMLHELPAPIVKHSKDEHSEKVEVVS